MNKKKSSKENRQLSVLSDKGTELLNWGHNRSTGFSIAAFNKGETYEDDFSRFYYILIILKGKIKLSCKLYLNKIIDVDTMAFIPKDSPFKLSAVENAEVMFFAFTTTIIRTDKDVLNYFCIHARKFNYTFNTLRVESEMKLVIEVIRTQLLSKKIKNPEICEAWNTLIIHTIQTFYHRSKVVAFMRPIFSSSINFETFIENNYIESAGNVSYLIELSGITPARFHSLFFEKYGMTAKAWLDSKARHRILAMAATEHVTVTDMAKVFKVSTQRFCRLCRRLFECTPGELIQRERLKREHKEE